MAIAKINYTKDLMVVKESLISKYCIIYNMRRRTLDQASNGVKFVKTSKNANAIIP